MVYSFWYNADLETLSDHHKERVERKIDVFVDKGWTASVRDRTVAPLRDGIYELGVLGSGAAFRVPFFLVPGRSPRMVVLTACVSKAMLKKRQRLDAELERTKHRRTIWLEQERKRRENAGR